MNKWTTNLSKIPRWFRVKLKSIST